MNKNVLAVLAVSLMGVTLGGCDMAYDHGHGDDHMMTKEGKAMHEEAVMDEVVTLDMDEMTDAPKMMAKYAEYSAEMFAALKGNEKFVVFFYADWCSTCRKWEKGLQENIATLPEGTLILKADYDIEKDLAKELGVTSQSTAVFFNMDGTVAEMSIDPSIEKLNTFFVQ